MVFIYALYAAILLFSNCFADAPPNFVMILADDLGWGDPSYNNGTTFTPSLDAFASSTHSIVFHRGYAGSPVCSPTRASTLTGRTPNRDCVYNANGCGSAPAWECSEPMPLPLSTFTIAEAAKKYNKQSKNDKNYKPYITSIFGKWHLGDFWNKSQGNNVSRPDQHGFDYWFTTEASAPSCTPNCGCFPPPYDDCITGHYNPGTPWCTNYWFADENAANGVMNLSYRINGSEQIDAVFLIDQFERWIGTVDLEKNNIMVMLWLHSVHNPWTATPEWREACSNGSICNISRRTGTNWTSEQLDYFGDVASMDTQIGRVRDILKKQNIYDNTYLYFTSDNGPEPPGQDGMDVPHWGNSEWPGSTNGFRGRKADVWEGGIREATIIEWPDIVKYNKLTTVMDILNVTSDNIDWAIDGETILPMLLKNGEMENRTKNMGWILGKGKGYQTNEWKIVKDSAHCNSSKGECPWALYNILNDPFEQHNVTDENLDLFNDLYTEFQTWQTSVENSQMNESGCGVKNPYKDPNLVFDMS